MHRPTPLFVAVITLFVLAAVTATVVITARNAAIEKQAEDLLRPVDNRYPEIPECDDGVELWDCIRYTTGESNETENR